MAMLMPTMAAVHEQVHERAGEQDEIGQHTQEVRGMLGEEEEASDEQEADQNDLAARSEEHTSELQSLMRISYAVFCLKKKKKKKPYNTKTIEYKTNKCT